MSSELNDYDVAVVEARVRWTSEALAAKRAAEAYMATLTPDDPVICAARRVALVEEQDSYRRRSQRQR